MTPASEVTLVKIGGAVAAVREAVGELLAEIGALGNCVLVHGGGATLTAWSGRMGLVAAFDDGVRRTSPRKWSWPIWFSAGW